MNTTQGDIDWIQDVFEQMSREMNAILERGLTFRRIRARRIPTRAAGRRQVHISFRFGMRLRDSERHGALLVPLPDAMAMASYLLMLSDRTVDCVRGLDTPDATLKEAMLDLGRYLTASVASGSRGRFPRDLHVTFLGCQGVHPDVRPAFPYTEGDDLVIGWAEAQLGRREPFRALLALPGFS